MFERSPPPLHASSEVRWYVHSVEPRLYYSSEMYNDALLGTEARFYICCDPVRLSTGYRHVIF